MPEFKTQQIYPFQAQVTSDGLEQKYWYDKNQ
jgi:hypothetical protein